MIKRLGIILALLSLALASIVAGATFVNTNDIAYAFRVVAIWLIILPPVLSWNRFRTELATAISSMIWIATCIHLGEFFGTLVWGALLIFSSTSAYKIWRYNHI